MGRKISLYYYTNISFLHDYLSILIDIKGLESNLKDLSEIKNQIGLIKEIINYTINLFNQMKNKYNKLSIDQELFYNNIISLNSCINNGKLISFIDNTIDTINKYNKQSLYDIPDEEKDKIVIELSNINPNIQNILLNCHILMNQIKDYLGDNYYCLNLRYIRNFFKNNIFDSIEQFQVELYNSYNFEEKILITKDKCKLEYIIIRKNIDAPSKKLMIICGPNGVPYQIFVRNFKFEYYLEMNIDILFWNYRGYGLSKGKPSYNKLRMDILELFDEIKKIYNYEKFAVHGISIGGIPCCHLANHRKEIQLMICDRNFGRLDNLTQSFPCGKFLFYLYKLFFFQSTDNVDNYLNVKCYKIILNDPLDTIVLDSCSLKTLISAKLCEKYFECYSENNNNIDRNNNNYNVNELESLSKKSLNTSQNIPLTDLNDKISFNKKNNIRKENKNSKISLKKTALDKIFNSVKEKEKFVNLLIDISNIFKDNNKNIFFLQTKENCLKKLINKFRNKKNRYSNLKEEEIQNTVGIISNRIKNNIEDIFDSLECSGDTLYTLFSLKRFYTKAIYIDNFFNNLFIWGSKYYKINEEYSIHTTKNIKYIFEEIIKLFEELLNSQDIINHKEINLIKDIETLYKYFIQIQNNLKYVGLNTKDGFVNLINEDLIGDNDYEQYLKKINIGNYVPLKCGHNGALSKKENKLFQRYLNKSNFFNDKNDK